MKIAKAVFLAGLLAVGLACGYSKPATTPPSPGTTPKIVSLVPNSTTAGMSLGANGLMVTGNNFSGAAAVYWNGTKQPTTFVSASQLTATIPDPDTATAGSATVTVVNPGTQGGQYGGGTLPETSNSMTFTIN
jgi:hypothetical protein